MNISRFFGSTNREAMRQVRLALGPDALIVSNRRVNGGVEILATDATSGAADGELPIPEQVQVEPSRMAPLPPAVPAGGADVMDAIGALRGALEGRIDELMWSNQLKRAPQAAVLFQSMLGFGFSTALLRAMLKRLPEQLSPKAALQWARQELVKHLPVPDSEDALWRPGLALALVGPTGVGKTTTLAKLAARAVRRFGPQNVVLLTTDTYRIGAHEQLKIYGQILRVPVHVAQDATELRQIMQGIRPDQLILIDNVGISQRDSYVAEQAAMLANTGRTVQRLLVLNASSHGDTLDEVARTYRNDGGTPLAGCIITKLDETLRLGAALDTTIRYQLPIHYVSIGQKVPEHLLFLSSAELIDKALLAAPSSSALYAPTEADFAALLSLAKPQAGQEAQQQAQEARRRFLLPGLLATTRPHQQALPQETISRACQEVDEQTASAEAFDQWHAFVGGSPVPLDNGGLARHLLARAQSDIARDASAACVLITHDQASVSTQREGRGKLRYSLVGSPQAGILLSPLQSLQFADGWLSSCGEGALTAPDTAQAWLHPLAWFGEHAVRAQQLHVFEGGSAQVWRRLGATGANWAVQCGGATAVAHEDCMTTVGALAKQAAYRPVAAAAWGSVLKTCVGRPLAQVAIWAGVHDVALRQRGQPDMALRLLHVRIQDRQDGKVLKQFSAISQATFDDAVLVQALVLRHEQKWVLRAVQAFWRVFAQPGAAGTAQEQAMLAVQMGLASWQLLQSGHTDATRQVLAYLCQDAGQSPGSAAAGVLRLFAMKEVLE